ncbi:MAG: leucyl aminopeptidase family protein [Rhodobacteraceae bacterium]|nr:leucyl aminopeptidase family protein [Paracoccaceae bacterium]
MQKIPDFAPAGGDAIPIYVLPRADLYRVNELAGETAANWVKSTGFTCEAGQVINLPDASGAVVAVLVGDPRDGKQPVPRFVLASVMQRLAPGNYRLVGDFSIDEKNEAALASLLAQYRFDHYQQSDNSRAQLELPTDCDRNRLLAIAAGEFTARDLINQPASRLDPFRLVDHIESLAKTYDAKLDVIEGERLKSEFPLIHAVGAAGAHSCLVDLRWGHGPLVTVIGKGVCFDTGGLNIKPDRAMRFMKKDMGGAATGIGLAETIMRLDLPIRLRLLIPAVENAIAGNAMRPGDILTARSGCHVEITNTDAEGRLVLADAIDYAQEEESQLLVTLATLTGAARVALGTDIVPIYTDCDELASRLLQSSQRVRDPLWRMPLWDGYESMLNSKIADCVNAAESGFAGSMTAALFLRKFLHRPVRWAHFDVYCWQNQPRPGRPVGGIGQAWRALLDALPETLNL